MYLRKRVVKMQSLEMKEIVGRIHRLMVKRNLSQIELSRMSGVPASMINRILHSKSSMKVENFVKICLALQVSADELLNTSRCPF